MLDALFRSFFDLSPVVFTQGEFRFAASTGSYVAAAAVAVAAALTIYAYRQGHGRPAQRLTLAAIRRRSEPVAELERSGALKLVGAFYDVATGVVEFLP